MGLFSTFVVLPKDEAAFLPLLPKGYEQQKRGTILIGAATREGVCCGVLWLEQIGLQLRLLHIETAEGYRHQGVANQLLDDLYYCAGRLRTPPVITAGFTRTRELEGLYQLLAGRTEITLTRESTAFRISPAARKSSRSYGQLSGRTVQTVPFWSQPTLERNRLLQQMSPEERRYLAAIPPESFCRELCLACGKPLRSALFMTRQGRRQLELSFLYVSPGAKSAHDLRQLLIAACSRLEQGYQDHMLDVYVEEQRIRDMVYKLFPYHLMQLTRLRADWAFYASGERGGRA